jgi:DNA-binding SARP family transcriptional activator
VTAKVKIPPVFGLSRPRLTDSLNRVWTVPFTLLVAPAGSGKTTALSHLATEATAAGRLTAWYRAEPSDGDEHAVLRYLDAAFARSTGSHPEGWTSVEAAAAAMEARAGPEMALIIDDLHTLEGSSGELALERLLGYFPPNVHLVAAARRPPLFNLARLRLLDQLIEIGPEDLRFRSWETDELFRQHFGDPLAPEQLAELHRRTDGWAAGLHMFRIATRGKTPDDQQDVLASLSDRLVDLREYFDQNVFNGLDRDLRRFVVRTSPLGRLTVQWCDELLNGRQSNRLLHEIERRYGLLTADGTGATLRYSELLRVRLDEMLVEDLGEAEARKLHQRAGRILESGRALPEALRAYCRAADWQAVEALLVRSGEGVLDDLDQAASLVPALQDRDGWVLLARARRQVIAGDWLAAVDTYNQSENSFGSASAAATCRREKRALEAWTGPGDSWPDGWAGRLRQSLASGLPDLEGRDPPADPMSRLVTAMSELARGRFAEAGEWLRSLCTDGAASPVVHAYAQLASGMVNALRGEPEREKLVAAAEGIEKFAPPWLPRLIFTVAFGSVDAISTEVRAARHASRAASNSWLTAALALAEGIALLVGGHTVQATQLLREAQHEFERFEAGVLATWAQAFAGLATAATNPTVAGSASLDAIEAAKAAGCIGAMALSLRVRGMVCNDPVSLRKALDVEKTGAVDLSRVVERVFGQRAKSGETDVTAEIQGSGIDVARPIVKVTCLGGLALTIGGRAVDSFGVRPRARAVLQMLALNAGRPVHRDYILGCLWPDDLKGGLRNLQVALSSLRRLVTAASGRAMPGMIGREGDCYLLATNGSPADVELLEQLFEAGHRGTLSGDFEQAGLDLGCALELYKGDLLPEAGTADWVLEPRERYRLMAARSAQDLATCSLALGNLPATLDACQRGLQIDRYSDGLWRTLVGAYEQAHDHLGATRARKDYEQVLCELDFSLAGPAV